MLIVDDAKYWGFFALSSQCSFSIEIWEDRFVEEFYESVEK